jgi:hypothetical protein
MRDERGRWLAGTPSPNPSGRPAIASEVRSLAREHGATAIQRLADLMHSQNERAAIAACIALLERGYGRPEGPAREAAGIGLANLLQAIARNREAAQAHGWSDQAKVVDAATVEPLSGNRAHRYGSQ